MPTVNNSQSFSTSSIAIERPSVMLVFEQDGDATENARFTTVAEYSNQSFKSGQVEVKLLAGTREEFHHSLDALIKLVADLPELAHRHFERTDERVEIIHRALHAADATLQGFALHPEDEQQVRKILGHCGQPADLDSDVAF